MGIAKDATDLNILESCIGQVNVRLYTDLLNPSYTNSSLYNPLVFSQCA